ncbi:MAG: ATP-binding protein [Anaerolineales bacterium]
MSSLPDIFSILARGMGPDLHWFPEDAPVTSLAATMTGMANTGGGSILIGITPRSGQVQGVRDVEKAIELSFQAALLVDPALVLPVPRVFSTGGLNSTQILWVTIPAGLPHVYSLDGSYLGRDGRQTNPLSARRLRQLLVERGAIQLETAVPPQATLADLDPQQTEAYLDLLKGSTGLFKGAGREASQEILMQRGCLKRVNGELRPTYAAVLLFGRYPQQWLPNSTILAAHFPGIAFSDRFIKQDISGTLPEQIRQADAFVQANLRKVVRLAGLTRQEAPEYPLEAVRELLVNAIAHRDYNLQGDNIHLNIFSDRLEVQSPGRLPGPVTLDNLLEARFSRNAIIVQVLSDMGFIERLGYGLDRVVTVLRQNQLRPPRFEEIAGCFRVTLHAPYIGHDSVSIPDLSKYKDMNLNPRQEMALTHLALHRRISNSSYRELCPDVHPETLRRDLAELVSRGILLKIGDKRATYYILK